ncbi:MAG: MmgE/PrpD family protein [Dehalococcoidia bacterium]
MADYLDTIAAFIADTRYESIPPEALDAARWILLDTLGGTLASSTLDETRRFATFAAAQSGRADCTLVGFAERADRLYAAMLNSTSACSYETDEGSRFGGGHPAIHIVPPALAEAEFRHAGGKELLTTIVVAYEVMSRLASGGPSRWPIHSHGTHGSPGSAAAVASLRRMDAPAIRNVLNLAACMSPATTWKVCFEGGTVRNLFSAESCLLGMLAVDLAACGYTGAEDGPSEMFGQVLGQGTYDTAKVVQGLGRQWRVTANYFKLHASCAITHPSLDATYNILRERPLDAGEIEAINVHQGGLARHLAYDDPANMLSAKFSIPYSVAAAVVRGDTGITAFRAPALDDPAIRALATRVVVHDDPAAASLPPSERVTRVEVRLTDGHTLRSETRIVRGDAENPVERAVLLDKFRFLAGQRCDEATVAAIYDRVMHIDDVGDVASLHDALTGAAMAGHPA